MLDRLSKLSNESESIVNQLEAAELKASAAEKSAGTMETQLQETQVYFINNNIFFFFFNIKCFIILLNLLKILFMIDTS